nr:hypothetical protein [Tanacetum cinerariifolium]
MQTQTSNTLHNAIMKAGGKVHPPVLAPGNYVQWISRIKRYIDTKPNHELIHYCLKNPPYKYTWADKITQTSNTLHNAIMKAGGKDHPPVLAPGNYVQWTSRIKRYIDTKPNHEIIHYCLKNPPYKYTWADKTVPVSEGSYETTTVTYMENYKNVSQDIYDQLNAEAEVVQIILTGIDNDIYSTVDACPNACEMWKAIERLKHGDTNITIDSMDMSTNGETVEQDDDDLAKERDLLASLIEKQKCEINDSKNRNKFLKSSNKTLVDKLKVDVVSVIFVKLFCCCCRVVDFLLKLLLLQLMDVNDVIGTYGFTQTQ